MRMSNRRLAHHHIQQLHQLNEVPSPPPRGPATWLEPHAVVGKPWITFAALQTHHYLTELALEPHHWLLA